MEDERTVSVRFSLLVHSSLSLRRVRTDKAPEANKEKDMFNTLKTAALSAVIGLGAIAAIPATAQAEASTSVSATTRSRASASIRRRRSRYDDRRRERDGAGCSPDRALGQGRAHGSAPRPRRRRQPPHHESRRAASMATASW